MKKYILAIDQGTTKTLVGLVNNKGIIVDRLSMDVKQQTLNNGAIIQNPEEIYLSVELLIKKILNKKDLSPSNIDSIGITNQRETTIIWNKDTLDIIDNAISWQSIHTNEITNQWIKEGYEKIVSEKTGLMIHPYFSASKIKYILNNYQGNIDNLLFGTVDSYLLYRLTKGKSHYTDVTNASRTMLYNILDNKWDSDLLKAFGIPLNILPKVLNNDTLFGEYELGGILIPIYSMIGDQQAALFGHLCLNEGDLKVTYGTGCFMLLNIGENSTLRKKGLLTTIAYKTKEQTVYALEGSILMGGATITYLKEQLGLIKDVNETEKLSFSSNDNDVFVVPSFIGLGAPHWDYDVKAAILGITTKTNKADIVKAGLNSIAYQVTDILNLVKEDSTIKINEIKVDGGASNNKYLMQYQADLVNVNLMQNKESEITALGTAYLAGLNSGFFKNIEELKRSHLIKEVFIPSSDRIKPTRDYNKWLKAISAVKLFK